MIRKGALQIAVPALLVCIALNASLVVDHLRQMQKIATLTLESSVMQVSISGFLNDLTDMETGQRGYLLTNDPSYLPPYIAAKNRTESDFASLRAKLTSRTEGERSLESQLESIVKSKQVEMERTIDLRQRGYRHRSFMLVATNEGKDYMDQARRIISSLSSAESSNFLRFDTERTVRLKRVLSVTIVTNSGLLVLAACLFGLIRYDRSVLAEESAQ